MSTQSTPKRPHTDMFFSPENGNPNGNFKDVLREVLDEKLKEHIGPLKENICALEAGLSELTNKQKKDVEQLRSENENLKIHINKLETYQRKNNIRFLNMPEDKDENLEQKVLDICNRFLERDKKLDWRSFERVHRLGTSAKDEHPVIARVANFKDKQSIHKIKKEISNQYNITITDDLPVEVVEARRKLFPVMEALKADLKQAKKDPAGIYLKEDKLIVKSKVYGVKDLEKSNQELNLNKLFTPTRNDITAFYSKYSVLSNHFPCRFKAKGETYSSMEKYLHCRIAQLFEDQQLVHKISEEDDPVVIKRLGKNIKNFDKAIWKREIGTILYDGLFEKFQQNPDLGEYLVNTGESVIVEASKTDKQYGIGYGLGDQRLWDRKQWKGQNLMGKTLMKVRSDIKKHSKTNTI